MKFTAAILVLATTSTIWAQRMFPHTPETHHVRSAVGRLKKEGLVAGRAPSHVGRDPIRIPATYENFAIFAETSILSLDEYLGRLFDLSDKEFQRKYLQAESMAERTRYYEAELVPDLHILIDTFFIGKTNPKRTSLRREIQKCSPKLDRIVSLCRKSLAAEDGRQPFGDVPPSHWANKAVQGLGLEGLLRGYPDGRFSKK